METSLNGRITVLTASKPGGWLTVRAHRLLASLLRIVALGAVATLLAGCSWSELSRLDRSVQASWSVLRGADTMSTVLAERLIQGHHTALSADPNYATKLRSAVDAVRVYDEASRIDLTDQAAVSAYMAARSKLIDRLSQLSRAIAGRSTPTRAWRSRALRQQLDFALLRSSEAIRDYNTAAGVYNQALGRGRGRFAKVLLYPGIRKVALLEDSESVADMK